MLETHVKLCMKEQNFLEKVLLPQKYGKWTKKWVSWNYWKMWSLIFTEFVQSWELILFAVFLHKPLCRKTLFPGIWAKMLSPSQIPGFLNQLNPRKNWWNSLIFCMKFTKIKSWWKCLGGSGQRWVLSVWSWYSRRECTSRMKRQNKLIFCILLQIQES